MDLFAVLKLLVHWTHAIFSRKNQEKIPADFGKMHLESLYKLNFLHFHSNSPNSLKNWGIEITRGWAESKEGTLLARTKAHGRRKWLFTSIKNSKGVNLLERHCKAAFKAAFKAALV